MDRVRLNPYINFKYVTFHFKNKHNLQPSILFCLLIGIIRNIKGFGNHVHKRRTGLNYFCRGHFGTEFPKYLT